MLLSNAGQAGTWMQSSFIHSAPAPKFSTKKVRKLLAMMSPALQTQPSLALFLQLLTSDLPLLLSSDGPPARHYGRVALCVIGQTDVRACGMANASAGFLMGGRELCRGAYVCDRQIYLRRHDATTLTRGVPRV